LGVSILPFCAPTTTYFSLGYSQSRIRSRVDTHNPGFGPELDRIFATVLPVHHVQKYHQIPTHLANIVAKNSFGELGGGGIGRVGGIPAREHKFLINI
jgi:hypothetical protein